MWKGDDRVPTGRFLQEVQIALTKVPGEVPATIQSLTEAGRILAEVDADYGMSDVWQGREDTFEKIRLLFAQEASLRELACEVLQAITDVQNGNVDDFPDEFGTMDDLIDFLFGRIEQKNGGGSFHGQENLRQRVGLNGRRIVRLVNAAITGRRGAPEQLAASDQE